MYFSILSKQIPYSFILIYGKLDLDIALTLEMVAFISSGCLCIKQTSNFRVISAQNKNSNNDYTLVCTIHCYLMLICIQFCLKWSIPHHTLENTFSVTLLSMLQNSWSLWYNILVCGFCFHSFKVAPLCAPDAISSFHKGKRDKDNTMSVPASLWLLMGKQ